MIAIVIPHYLINPPRPLASERVEARGILYYCINTIRLPLPYPSPGVRPRHLLLDWSDAGGIQTIIIISQNAPKGRHSPARSISSSKIISEKHISENPLDDFPTFWNDGSTFSLLSGKPARRFPYFLDSRLDDPPIFWTTWLTFSLLSGPLGLPYAFAAISHCW